MTETKKLDATTGTELTRFNALRHGILSRFTVLPWESREEYETVLAALVAEHAPQGPTEEHLVEELAHIMWRKRRLRLAEAAAHRRALGTILSSLNPFSAEEAAVITIPPISEGERIERAISATDQQSAEELAALKQERDKAKAALEVLRTGDADAYDKSVEALGPQTLEHWQERMKYDFGDGEPPFEANASDLLRFLTKLVLPEHDAREIQIQSRPVVQAQAFGESFDPNRLEVLARHEVHLDRKLERILTMLLGLKDLRRSVDRD
jgi:hypothetical protein